MGKPREKKE